MSVRKFVDPCRASLIATQVFLLLMPGSIFVTSSAVGAHSTTGERDLLLSKSTTLRRTYSSTCIIRSDGKYWVTFERAMDETNYNRMPYMGGSHEILWAIALFAVYTGAFLEAAMEASTMCGHR